MIADGKFTVFPNTIWRGLNPLTLMKEFVALIVPARAASHWQLISSLSFKRISVKIVFCRSHISLHHGDSADVDIFILKFFAKVWELFRDKLSSIITKYFWWTAKNTNPALKKVLNNNSRVFAFNSGGTTKSGKFVNYIKVLNIFIKIMKIHCNSEIECFCSW